MSGWRGFDQRKICPQCGEYQTRVAAYRSLVRDSLWTGRRIGLLVVVGLLILLLRLFPTWTTVLATSFFVLVLSGVLLLAYREFSRTSDDAPKSGMLGYKLYCDHCGHKWEMTAAEWDAAGLRELQNPLPQDHETVEMLTPIEWKPSQPWQGPLILIGTSAVALLAAASAVGVIWSLNHPGYPHALLIQAGAGIVALSILTGMMLLFNRRAVWKAVLLWLLLIGAVGVALLVWLRSVRGAF